MDCIPLKTMEDGRIKLLVFGRRYWKGHDDEKRIRYVSADRVYAKEGRRQSVAGADFDEMIARARERGISINTSE